MKVALILAALIILCSYGMACADDFSDFRIPTHRVFSVSAAAYGSFGNTNNENKENDYSRQWRMDGQYGGRAYWLYDSDPFRAKVSFDLSGAGSTQNSSSRYNSETTRAKRHNNYRHLYSDYRISLDNRYFPWSLPIGCIMSGNLSAGFSASWNGTETEDNQVDYYRFASSNEDHWKHSYSASATIGAGFGRVRDATSVYDVYVLEHRLLKSGAITRNLSDSARKRLYALLYFEGEYSNLHNQPAKFFWQALEGILRDDGVVKADGIDAYSLYRITERYLSISNYNSVSFDQSSDEQHPTSPRRSFLRSSGYFIGLTVFPSHYHNLETIRLHSNEYHADSLGEDFDGASSVIETNRWNDIVPWGIQLEYHLPWLTRWQFDAHIVGKKSDYRKQRQTVSESNLGVFYLIADRWICSSSITHEWGKYKDLQNQYNNREWWMLRAGFSLSYFIEDHLSLHLYYNHNESYKYINLYIVESQSSGNLNEKSSNQINLGITYYISGKLSAPGIASSNLMDWPKSLWE